MRKPLIFVLDSEIYPFKVVFYVGAQPEVKTIARLAKRHLRWTGGDADLSVINGAIAQTWSTCTGSIVWLQSARVSDPHTCGVFIHELTHVSSNLGSIIGESQKLNRDEMHAYFMQWVTEQFLERVAKARR